MNAKPEIAVLYSLARSGATLVTRCLGSIPGNILLSEVNPRWAPFNPLTQAMEWFGLVSADEFRAYKSAPRYTYTDAIRLISERVRISGQKLVIRDWTQIEFIPGRYPAAPSYRLTQADVLREYFEINQAALVRDPLDTYLSLTKFPDFRDWLSLETFLAGYRLFAEALPDAACIHYEYFCREPDMAIKQLSGKLGINYDPCFIDIYSGYSSITGETYSGNREYTLTGDSIAERAPRKIQVMPKRPEYEKLHEIAADNEDYNASQQILGQKIVT